MADRSLEFVALVASLSADGVGNSASSAAANGALHTSAGAAKASTRNGASSASSSTDSFSTAARAALAPVRAALSRIATASATRHAYLAIAAEEAPSSALAAALPSAAAMSDDQRIRFEEVRINLSGCFAYTCDVDNWLTVLLCISTSGRTYWLWHERRSPKSMLCGKRPIARL
jgi:hypothetical protein